MELYTIDVVIYINTCTLRRPDLNSAIGKSKSFLNNGRELSDPSALLPKHVLSACGKDDNLCSSGGHSNLNSRVTIFRQLPGQEIIEFSFEHTVSDELGELKE